MIINDTEECRDEIAIRAMQGLITRSDLAVFEHDGRATFRYRACAKAAYGMADELINFKRLGYSYK